jgi:hypothetical protein
VYYVDYYSISAIVQYGHDSLYEYISRLFKDVRVGRVVLTPPGSRTSKGLNLPPLGGLKGVVGPLVFLEVYKDSGIRAEVYTDRWILRNLERGRTVTFCRRLH